MEEKQDGLCIKILQTLREMMAVDPEYGEKGDTLRISLLIRYLGKFPLPQNPRAAAVAAAAAQLASPVSTHHGPGSKFLVRAQMSLHEVQCHLDIQGASKLIVDLVIKSANMPKIFSEAVELGSALLEGGNQEIQKSLFAQLHSGEVSQSFFKVFHDKTTGAQAEIKSTVTVNTSDIAARASGGGGSAGGGGGGGGGGAGDKAARELEKAVRKRGREFPHINFNIFGFDWECRDFSFDRISVVVPFVRI